jgi:hypothetical protein
MAIVFVGYVEQPYPMNDQQQRVLARELTAVLNQWVPLTAKSCWPPWATTLSKLVRNPPDQSDPTLARNRKPGSGAR